MIPNDSNDSNGLSSDKFDTHHRQQLSALVDGELSADEARFMLRRLEHDAQLGGCHERWHMIGDVMRGQACAPAPVNFSARVRLAVAAEPVPAATPRQSRAVSGWMRWSGGAAIAASVAALAMFMGRGQMPQSPAEAPAPMVATVADVPAPVAAASVPVPVPTPTPAPAPAPSAAELVASAAPAVAVAAATRRPEGSRRGSATRNQQVARAASLRQAEAIPAVAAVAAPATALPVAQDNPFASLQAPLPARPWPRSTVASGLPQGTFNATLSAQEPGSPTFYPLEPRLPADTPSHGTARGE